MVVFTVWLLSIETILPCRWKQQELYGCCFLSCWQELFFFFLTPQTFPWERCWEQLSGKKWDETNKNDWPHYFWMMSPFLRDCWAIEAAEVFLNIFSKLFWWAKTQKQSFIHMFGFLLVHFWPQRWRGIVELPLTHTLWALTSLLIINLKDWSITAF